MNTLTSPRRPLLRSPGATLLSLVLIACTHSKATPSAPQKSASDAASFVVFLVRHAEKVNNSRDAALSNAGRVRARQLAGLLRDSELDAIHSSDFARTRDTAMPLAEKLGLPLELYDTAALDALAKRLRQAGGRHLVVGHSNTTPRLAEKLGGDPGAEIAHDEYDRLYVLSGDADGETTTVLLRFGD